MNNTDLLQCINNLDTFFCFKQREEINICSPSQNTKTQLIIPTSSTSLPSSASLPFSTPLPSPSSASASPTSLISTKQKLPAVQSPTTTSPNTSQLINTHISNNSTSHYGNNLQKTVQLNDNIPYTTSNKSNELLVGNLMNIIETLETKLGSIVNYCKLHNCDTSQLHAVDNSFNVLNDRLSKIEQVCKHNQNVVIHPNSAHEDTSSHTNIFKTIRTIQDEIKLCINGHKHYGVLLKSDCHMSITINNGKILLSDTTLKVSNNMFCEMSTIHGFISIFNVCNGHIYNGLSIEQHNGKHIVFNISNRPVVPIGINIQCKIIMEMSYK